MRIYTASVAPTFRSWNLPWQALRTVVQKSRYNFLTAPLLFHHKPLRTRFKRHTAYDPSDTFIDNTPTACFRANLTNIYGYSQNVSRESFSLPSLGVKLLEIREEIIRGRGFQLIKGIPVNQWSRRQVAIAYWGIGLFLGRAESNNKKGHLIGHIKDIGHDPSLATTRLYATHEAQPYHNDSSDIVGALPNRLSRKTVPLQEYIKQTIVAVVPCRDLIKHDNSVRALLMPYRDSDKCICLAIS